MEGELIEGCRWAWGQAIDLICIAGCILSLGDGKEGFNLYVQCFVPEQKSQTIGIVSQAERPLGSVTHRP